MDLNTLTRLFDGLDSYIIAVDSEFNIKFTNGRVSLISGKHPDEMLNKKCYNVVHGYNKPCKNCPIAENKDFTGTKVIIKDIVTYKGERIFARSAFTRISDDLYVSSFIDITEPFEMMLSLPFVLELLLPVRFSPFATSVSESKLSQ